MGICKPKLCIKTKQHVIANKHSLLKWCLNGTGGRFFFLDIAAGEYRTARISYLPIDKYNVTILKMTIYNLAFKIAIRVFP